MNTPIPTGDCAVIALSATDMVVKAKVLGDFFAAGFHVTAVVHCGLNHQIYLERRAPLDSCHRPEGER